MTSLSVVGLNTVKETWKEDRSSEHRWNALVITHLWRHCTYFCGSVCPPYVMTTFLLDWLYHTRLTGFRTVCHLLFS